MAKIATIKDFSGMEENGLWYLEGMKPKKVGGKSVLTPYYYNQYLASEDTSGFANMTVINGGDSMASLVSANPNVFFISQNGYIHSIDAVIPANNIGLVHTPYKTAITYGDLAVTKNNNLVYTNLDYLGVGYRDLVKTGSSATQIVSTAGNNWTTKGIVAGDKVINLTTGEEHSIASITTTDSADDTLTFASGGANTANDIFMAFADAGATTIFSFNVTTAYPHFVGQEAKANFRRQIIKFSSGTTGKFLIGNGNFLAALDMDETTFDDNYKQLPDMTQFRCMATNSGTILVGATINGKGRLLLWDDFSDGWLSILDMEQVPMAVTPYKTGYIAVIGTSLYFTDGYNLQLLTTYPDTEIMNRNLVDSFNGLKVVGENIYISINTGATGLMRDRCGVAIYEVGKGWTLVPYNADSASVPTINPLYDTTSGAIISVMNANISYIYTGFGGGDTTKNYCLNRVIHGFGYKNSAVVFVPLLRPANIKKIVLGLLPSSNSYASGSSDDVSVTVSVGNGRNLTNKKTTVGAGSTATSIVNTGGGTVTTSANVGDEIRILDYVTAGRRSWISSIADQGTASEVWTISPTLTDAPSENATISIWPFKKLDTKTIDADNIPDNVEFDATGIYGENLYIEVIIETSGGSTLDLNYIDIYA